MGRVHLTSILRKLVVENGSMEIGEMRSIMQSIFDTFIYERWSESNPKFPLNLNPYLNPKFPNPIPLP